MEQIRSHRDDASLIFLFEDGAVRVVLIATERDGVRRWALPKGHFKKRESADQAAVREVCEETGQVRLVDQLGTIDYWFVEHRVRYHKFVHYFLMRARGGSLDDHDDEVVEARWFDWDEALSAMAYENERSVLAENAERIRDLLSGSWSPA